MFDREHTLIAVALTYALAALVYYPPISGALVLALVFAFVSYVLWLKSRPKVEAPAIRGLHSELAALREQVDMLKSQQERMILNGGRRGN